MFLGSQDLNLAGKSPENRTFFREAQTSKKLETCHRLGFRV